MFKAVLKCNIDIEHNGMARIKKMHNYVTNCV